MTAADRTPGVIFLEPAPVRVICEAIWRIEVEHALLDDTIGGIHYWPLVRHMVVSLLLRQAGVIAGEDGGSSTRRKVARHLSAFFGGVPALPWLAAGSADTVVLPHDRKQSAYGEIIDPLIHAVISDKGFGDFLVMDLDGPQGMYAAGPGRRVCNRAAIASIAQIAGRMQFPRILGTSQNTWRRLDDAFRAESGFGFPLSVVALAQRIAIFDAGRRIVHPLLRRTGAKRLVLTNSNINHHYIAAAQDLGMTVSELQHCAITPYNLSWHYPGRPQVPYSADHFLLFGPAWLEGIELPAKMRAAVIGSPIAHAAKTGSKIARQVLAVSQGPTGRQLFAWVAAAAAAMPDWQFVFRPHPYESFDYYVAALAQSGATNIALSPWHQDYYALLASAEVQIGVNSTGLFEGMAFGCRTVVADLPGAELMSAMVANGGAVLARGADGLAQAIPFARQGDARAYYAPQVASVLDVIRQLDTDRV